MWTEEIFTIAERKNTRPIKYRLKDYGGEMVEGTFYAEELQKTLSEKDRVYCIEKVIRKYTRKGRHELLVKWMGYPSHFNSWVAEEERA